MRERIAAAGGDPAGVAIVAVTKGFGPEAPIAALQAGIADLGENYANELLRKAAAVAATGPGLAPRWHYLGAVQRNKVARLAPVVSCWQAVSRPEEAVAIARRSDRHPQVFVEVEVAVSEGRRGCSLADAPRVVSAAIEAGCEVRGLMTVAPLASPSTAGRPGAAVTSRGQAEISAEAFGKVARLASLLGLGELSMGMSHDLEQAIAAGSTMIRIGTALFGERTAR